MNDTTVAKLVQAAQTYAVRGAQQYLQAHNLKAISNEALCDCIISWIKIKLPEALHDAKEAMACNMTQIAETAFAASMVQAGIEAAKEASAV